jgi:hypothetical protein
MPTGAAPTFDECNCLAVRSAVMLARIVKFPCDRGLNHARVALCRDETKRMGERYTKPAQDCIHHQPPPLKLPAHEAHVRAAVRSDPSASRFDRLVDLLRRCENHRSPIAHHARDRLSSESIDTPTLVEICSQVARARTSDGGAEMAGDRIEVDILARSARLRTPHNRRQSLRPLSKAGNLGKNFELARRVRAVQKLIVERSASTNAFGRKPSPGLRTPPPGRMMYCISG